MQVSTQKMAIIQTVNQQKVISIHHGYCYCFNEI